MPVVWLFAVKQSKGSRTSFTNNIMAYEDLDLEIKKEIKDLKLVCGFSRGSYTTYTFGKDQDFNEYYTPPLVYTNNGNQTGLFFPFLQFRKFVGMTEKEFMEVALSHEISPWKFDTSSIQNSKKVNDFDKWSQVGSLDLKDSKPFIEKWRTNCSGCSKKR